MSRRFAFLAMLGYCFCPLALTFAAQQPVTGIPPLSSVSGDRSILLISQTSTCTFPFQCSAGLERECHLAKSEL